MIKLIKKLTKLNFNNSYFFNNLIKKVQKVNEYKYYTIIKVLLKKKKKKLKSKENH